VSAGTLQIATNQTISSSTAITNNATLLLGATNNSLVNTFTVSAGQTLTLTGSGTTVFSTTITGQIFNVASGEPCSSPIPPWSTPTQMQD